MGAMAAAPDAPVVIRISPMAHFAALLLAGTMLLPILALPWLSPMLLIPLAASFAVARLRTVATSEKVTARALLRTTTVRWEQIEGLKFVKSSWARAVLADGGELALPAVSFSTLPQLAAVSGGRVPNPYD
jgi:hypothetical protein